MFIQNAAPPHIAHCVNQLLRHHFFKDRTISLQFITAWPPRSLDLNPCDIWLWIYLKTMVYRDPIISLSDFKESIERHVRNIPQFMLLSTVEYAILHFQMVADNGGHHIEHVL